MSNISTISKELFLTVISFPSIIYLQDDIIKNLIKESQKKDKSEGEKDEYFKNSLHRF